MNLNMVGVMSYALCSISCSLRCQLAKSVSFVYVYSLKIAKNLGVDIRGGARGGLGAITPCWSMLAPRRRVKSDFSEIFGIYSALKAIF